MIASWTLGGARNGHAAVASASTAALSLIGGWTYAARLQPRGYDAAAESISALAATGAGSRWVMTLALVVTGCAHVVTALAVPSLRRPGRSLLAGAGVATLLVAALPLPDPHESSGAHIAVATVSFLLLAVWPWFAARDRTIHRAAAIVGLLAVALLGLVASGRVDLPFGRVERLVAADLVLWPLATAALAWWRAGHRIGSRTARRGLALGATTVACALAGTAMTAVAPVTTQTRHYAAQVWLDPDPFASASLVAPTVFGDIDVAFRGLAPGIRATPQVKASITELLSRPNISASSLAPGPLELDKAIRSAATGLAVRFAVGSLLIVGLVVLAGSLRRRRFAGWAATARALGAAVLAMAVTGASAALTYRPDQASGFTSNGILSTVQANSGLLADVEARSKEVAPYLTNLVALTNALQQRYRPDPGDTTVALRLLLISDVHGGNQFPLAKELITAEQVDAVVDAGDLLTFGTVEEGEAAGIFDGIASLGVPYFFVKGNHDATSSTDRAVLDRLAMIPNVVLLHPDDDHFTEATLHGIRITGINDTRWFGDDGKRTADRQRPAIEAYQSAFVGRHEPDLFVTHHPLGAREVTAKVTGNGHMHTPSLEGNRIQVGTFTGGGPFTHYVQTEDGGELAGQPSAFDLLTFGTDCHVAELTRFTFRNLIEGRPAYDQVSIINGNRLDTSAATQGRTCPATGTLSRTEVTVP
ncbi:MAG: DUF998 domain-containing protein [Actinobacteria bacterium]|nr:DUF998 domain-containing protein [Actinomycetota bacterium]